LSDSCGFVSTDLHVYAQLQVSNSLTDSSGSWAKQQEQMKHESQKQHLVWSEEICKKENVDFEKLIKLG
jgi:hypothetical protein